MLSGQKNLDRQTQCGSSTETILSTLVPAWSHIELGAANYADNLKGDNTYQHATSISADKDNVLYKTLDSLIQSKGKNGVFYINDLDEHSVNYAIRLAEQYVASHYKDSHISIKPLVGDFFKIELPYVDSIDLKNPEYWLFTSLDMAENKNRLTYFADHAKEGLTLITFYKRPFLNRLESLGVGYKIINDEYDPYIHIDGKAILRTGNVIQFNVQSINTLRHDGKIAEYSIKHINPQQKSADIKKDILDDTFNEYENDPKYIPKDSLRDTMKKDIFGDNFNEYENDPKYVPNDPLGDSKMIYKKVLHI